jgi:hypothetical protein
MENSIDYTNLKSGYYYFFLNKSVLYKLKIADSIKAKCFGKNM